MPYNNTSTGIDTGRNPHYDEFFHWFYKDLDAKAGIVSKPVRPNTKTVTYPTYIPSYNGPADLFKPPRIEKNLPQRFYLSGQLGGTGKGIAVSRKDGAI